MGKNTFMRKKYCYEFLLIRLVALLESKQRTAALEDFTIRCGEHIRTDRASSFIYRKVNSATNFYLSILQILAKKKNLRDLQKGDAFLILLILLILIWFHVSAMSNNTSR